MSKQKLITKERKSRQSRQKLSTLTIHEISPQWSKIIPFIPKTEQQEFYKNNNRLDISDCKFCVVGEAYGFKDSYSHVDNKEFCYDCYSCAINFGYSLLLPPVEREGFVTTFVDHWNQNHV